MKQDRILVIDLGSTINTDIAREIRSLGIYTEIHPHDLSEEGLNRLSNVKGIILNGGKNRIVNGVEIDASEAIYNAGAPILSVDHQGSEKWPEDKELRKNKLEDFAFNECGAKKGWNAESYIEEQVSIIRERVGDRKVLLALSGGVDSSVVAALLIKAIGQNLVCVHVDNGLMRKGETEAVVNVFSEELVDNLICVDAKDRFLDKLAGVADPEEKRKIIGNEFIYIFEEEAKKLDGIDFLAQGTIYSDVIESGTKTVKGLKSHHNVGGLPEDLKFELIEPLSMLFKDEVRECGIVLGLPEAMVYRQPFPGPGLGVRCLGAITEDRLEAVRESDAILQEEFKNAGLDKKVWQYFTVIPDFKSVGVKNQERSFDWPVIIRAVNTVDAMTASIERIPYDVLDIITERITNEVKGVNRVLYDLSPKPTGTIEWE